ncbi:mucin-5AC [Patella vulgata]|uniref:mucin-5AC n=1 Tax=Patella vulgata TaxID=6465 RepID=UPI00217F7B99|nr:mucin-5AC [Patella vulgata]
MNYYFVDSRHLYKESRLINMCEHRSTSEDELNQSAKWMTFFDEPTYDNYHRDLRNIKYRLSEQFESLELKASFKRGPTNESVVRKPTFEENEENVQEMRRVRKRRKKCCKYLTILIIFSIIIVAVITATVMSVVSKQSSVLEETSSLSKTTNSVEKESVSFLDSVGFNISSFTTTTLSYTEIVIESKEQTIKSSVSTEELQMTVSLISTTELTSFPSSTDTALSDVTALDSSLIETPTASISELSFDISLVSTMTMTSAFSDLETSTYSFDSAKQSTSGISTVFSGDIHPTTPTTPDPQSSTSLSFISHLQASTGSVRHTASPDIQSSATAASDTQWISSSQTVLETLTVPETLTLLSSTADVSIVTSLLSTVALTDLQILNPSSELFGSHSLPMISSALATPQSLGLEQSELLLSLTISKTGVQIPPSISVTSALTNLQEIPSSSLPFLSPSLSMSSMTSSTPELLLSLTISVTDVQTTPFISVNSAWTDLHELASSSEQLEQSWTVSDLLVPTGIQMSTSLVMPLQTSSPIYQTASSVTPTNDI